MSEVTRTTHTSDKPHGAGCSSPAPPPPPPVYGKKQACAAVGAVVTEVMETQGKGCLSMPIHAGLSLSHVAHVSMSNEVIF